MAAAISWEFWSLPVMPRTPLHANRSARLASGLAVSLFQKIAKQRPPRRTLKPRNRSEATRLPRGTRRGFSYHRSDGGRNRRRTDPISPIRKRGGDSARTRMQRVRQNVASEIGIILPKVRIRDNMRLEQNQYRIKIADMAVADGIIYPNMFLAIDSRMTTRKAPGHSNERSGLRHPRRLDRSRHTGSSRNDGLHGRRTGQRHRHASHRNRPEKCVTNILTRDATKHLVDELKKNAPAVVDELIPGMMKLPDVQRVSTDVVAGAGSDPSIGARSLKPSATTRARTKDHGFTDGIRSATAWPASICTRYRSPWKIGCYVITLDPTLEDRIRAGCRP